jgi:hypothetical protein
MRANLLVIPLIAVALTTLGCGNKSLPIVPVSGRITLDQGEWPAAGVLYFSPAEPKEGFPIKPGTARFEKNGKYVAMTKNGSEGLVPGKYYVNVECYTTPPSADPKAPPGKSCVPKQYESGKISGLMVDVPTDAKHVEANFEVISK